MRATMLASDDEDLFDDVMVREGGSGGVRGRRFERERERERR